MVRGAKYSLVLSAKNKTTGEAITDPTLVNDIELVLCHSGSTVGVKRYKVESGITAFGNGQYKLEISEEDTLLLPTKGTAFLEGFILPVRKSIKINLGNITDNKANAETPE